jgi:hypothetical protein
MSTKISKRKQKALAFRGKKKENKEEPFGEPDFIPLEDPEAPPTES